MRKRDLEQFLTALKAAYRDRQADAPQAQAAMIGDLLTSLDEAIEVRGDLDPREQAVCRHLEACLAAAEAGPLAGLMPVLRPLLPALHWVYRYQVEDKLPGFSENWAHAEFFGPQGKFVSHRNRLGLILMGPERFYPQHCHPARELYLILAGEARWQMGSGPFQPQAPGALVYHPSGIDHALMTGPAPLFAIYAWQGDVETRADWSRGAFENAATL